MQEILVFQQDRSADVRRFVVGFIEEAWQVLHFVALISTGSKSNASTMIENQVRFQNFTICAP